MDTTILIDRRFRGPRQSGNGGVSAGLAAAFIDGPASVRLRRPPPIETPLHVAQDGEGVAVLADGETVLEAAAADLEIEVPIDGRLLDGAFQRGTVRTPEGWAAPHCFVCGPRDDGLGIAPDLLGDNGICATVWTPDDSVSTDGESVDDHVVWGALDCPAGIAVTGGHDAELTYFPALVRLTARLEQPVRVGEPVVVIGWPESEDERRVNGGTAIVARDGTLLASAYAEHARLPLDFGGA